MKFLLILSLFFQAEPEFIKPSKEIVSSIVKLIETHHLVDANSHYIQNRTDELIVFNLDLAFAQTDSGLKNDFYSQQEPNEWKGIDFKIDVPKHYRKSIFSGKKRIRISSVRKHDLGNFIIAIVQVGKRENLNILFKIQDSGTVIIERGVKAVF